MLVWWAAPVECASALVRRRREGAIDHDVQQLALQRLRLLQAGWIEVAATDEVRATALRVLRLHALRAADSLHLAAAILAAGGAADSMEFVSFDARLAAAAQAEGFICPAS